MNEYPWIVISAGATVLPNGHMGHPGHWYIKNTLTGIAKRVGPVQLKGANYYDKAKALADQRNKLYAKKVNENTIRP